MANGHGGKRPGAGRPKKPLAEKILEGTERKHRPKVLNFEREEEPKPEPPEWIAYYGSKSAGLPDSQDIFKSTAAWLEKTGCLHLINPDFIMDYAIVKASWYEAQRLVTRFGLVYSPKEKNLIENPVIDVAMKYFKMSEIAWAKIWSIVAQNCEQSFGGNNPNSDLMEKLIRMNTEG